MTAELKPCPFCGGEASASGYIKYGKPLEDVFWDDGLPITETFFCNCIACGVTNINGRIGHQTRETSIAAWNTRANLPQSAIAAAMMGAVKPLVAEHGTYESIAKGGHVNEELAKVAGAIATVLDRILKGYYVSIPTDATAALGAALLGAYKEGWSDGAANCHHDRNETPDDGWLISDTYKSIPTDATAALDAMLAEAEQRGFDRAKDQAAKWCDEKLASAQEGYDEAQALGAPFELQQAWRAVIAHLRDAPAAIRAMKGGA